jgi:outer membrane lipoprotein SlyB
MQRTHIVWLITLSSFVLTALTAACGGARAVEDIPLGKEVAVTIRDGTVVRGKLIDVNPETLVLDRPNTGRHETIRRTAVAEVEPKEEGRSLLGDLRSDDREYREVTVAAGTTLPVELDGALASDTNAVEDPVHATLRSRVLVNGVEVIPTGSPVRGVVTQATPSGAVKGRARLTFDFRHVTVGEEIYDMRTKPFVYQAKSTKEEDATKIGVGAAAGGIIGAIAGGKKGAAVGAAVGSTAGTALVLATPGDEVQLRSGTEMSVELANPLTVRVPKTAFSALELRR